MRLDYTISLEHVEIPRFAVEAVEGIGKLFTLATLVLNVLDAKPKIEIIFHGLNPEDPERKIAGFKEIMASCSASHQLRYEVQAVGRVPGSSSSFQWLVVTREG